MMLLGIVTICLLLTQSVNCLQSTSNSLLTNTQWQLNLDVGLQPGTWMPKRFPGWAESGARLGLDVQVTFSDIPSATRESLVGPKDATYELQVSSSSPSTFVSERGEETVEFKSGGWCIQRPTANVRNAGGSLVKPEGLLRFWLDCTTGAKRRDVEIKPNTRIFFTTGVWDDPPSIGRRDEDYRKVVEDLQEIADKTRETRRESENKNMVENLASYGELMKDSKEYDRLKTLKQQYEGELPPLGSATATNGVKIAPTGSLVIKGNNIPDWLPGSEYLILGTFSTKSVDQ